LHLCPFLEIRSANILHALTLELLFDPRLPNYINFLIDGKLDDALDVDCGRVGRAKDLINLGGDPEAIELLLVGTSGLGGVVGDEDYLLAYFSRSVESSR
jgi:hypothetical protein